jgi:hypothetical protein
MVATITNICDQYLYLSLMPSSLSMIIYLTNYKGVVNGQFLIGNDKGMVRLDENDTIQETLYYPIGDLYECYLPRNIIQGCVLSIIDSKMCGIEQNILEVKKHYVFFKLNVLK